MLISTEISKKKSIALNITQFCAEMLLGERVYLAQSSIKGSTIKQSIESLFVTLNEDESTEIKKYKKHPFLKAEITFEEKNGSLSIAEINLYLWTTLRPVPDPYRHDKHLWYKPSENYHGAIGQISCLIKKTSTWQDLEKFLQNLLDSIKN